MCAQRDSNVVHNGSKKVERPSNFHEFWREEVHYKLDPEK
jgi:hypothetical protein